MVSISTQTFNCYHSLKVPSYRQINTTTMAPVLKKYKAAAVNAEPGWFDLQESVARTIHWINEAGRNGCKLIAFPELCTNVQFDYPFTKVILLVSG